MVDIIPPASYRLEDEDKAIIGRYIEKKYITNIAANNRYLATFSSKGEVRDDSKLYSRPAITIVYNDNYSFNYFAFI